MRTKIIGKAVIGLLFALALLLAGCDITASGSVSATTPPNPTDTTAPAGPTNTAGPAPSGTITMGGSSFVQPTSVSIKAGQAVEFNDPASTGGTHNLVTGTHGSFSAEAGAPAAFASSNGINFGPGDVQTIVFPTAGVYHITCTIHFNMQATITVS